MKVVSSFFVATMLTACLALSQVASASLWVTPGGDGNKSGDSAANALEEILTGNQTSQNQIDAAIAATLAGSIELYKANVGEADQGLFASSYETTYSNTLDDPSNFVIQWLSGPVITAATHLLVKNGNQEPAWYLFDIAGWAGDTITGFGFWPAQGAISHVTIYGHPAVIPEPGTFLIWGGLAAAASTVALVRARRASRK